MAEPGRRTLVLSAMALGWLWMGSRALAQQRDLARESGLPMLSVAEFNGSFEDLAEPTRSRRLGQLADNATAYVRAHFYVPPEAQAMVEALAGKMTMKMASALRKAGELGKPVMLIALLQRCVPAQCAQRCDLELRVDKGSFRFSVPRPPLPPGAHPPPWPTDPPTRGLPQPQN